MTGGEIWPWGETLSRRERNWKRKDVTRRLPAPISHWNPKEMSFDSLHSVTYNQENRCSKNNNNKCRVYLKRRRIRIPYRAQKRGFPFLAPIIAASTYWSPLPMCIVLNWKQPKLPLPEEWINKPCCTHMLEYYSAIKGINYWYIQQLGWISKTLCWTKEASPKRRNIIGCQLFDLLRKTKLWLWRTGELLPGVRSGGGDDDRGSWRNWSVFPLQ